jgi:hypothetical protein
MSEGDLSTADGIREFAKMLQHGVQREFLECQSIAPKAFVITNIHPEGLRLMESYGAVMVLSGEDFDGEGKENFASKVKLACNVLKAVGVFFLSECWMVMGDGTTPEKAKDSAEDMEDWITRYGSLEKYPGRKEVVMLTLEHKETGALTWFASISTVGGRKILEDFSEQVGFEKSSGRFTHLLQTD